MINYEVLCSVLYFSDKYILKLPKIFPVLEKIFQLNKIHGSVQSTIHNMLHSGESQVNFESSMKTFDLKTSSIQERKGLWSTRWWSFAVNSANLEDVKIDGHHLPITDGCPCPWIIMDGCMAVRQIREKGWDYCIGSGCCIILFVQPFLQQLIKVG